MTLQYTTVDDRYELRKAHHDDAGYDLHSAERVKIYPGQQKRVKTMYCIAPPAGWWGRIEDRSGYADRRVYAHGRIIDGGYRGRIEVMLENAGGEALVIIPGDRIAQLVLYPMFGGPTDKVTSLPPSGREAGGFGSTGK